MFSVLKARNLIAADSNGKSDPYCRVSVGTKVFSTTVHHNTLNPEWQQSIAFINDDLAPFAICQGTIYHCIETTGSHVSIYTIDSKCSSKQILLSGYLLVEVWDRDFGNPDDFIGRLVIPLASLPLAQVYKPHPHCYCHVIVM